MPCHRRFEISAGPHIHLGFREARRVFGREDRHRFSGCDDRRNPVFGKRRIDRHVGVASLDAREETDEQMGVFVTVNHDRLTVVGVPVDDGGGEAIGGRGQLRASECQRAPTMGNCVWVTVGKCGKGVKDVAAPID